MAQYREANGGYIDCHAWQFIPETFAALCSSLHEQGLIDLAPQAVFPTFRGYNEFCAILRNP